MKRKIFTIQSESKYLKPLRNQLRRFLAKLGFKGKELDFLLIALGEACTNSIRHAYGGEKGHLIRVTVENRKRGIIFKIRDYGHKIVLSNVKTPKLPPDKPHGLGIYLVKTMVDRLKYNTHHARGNELVLTKYKKRNS